MKKLTLDDLKLFRTMQEIPISDEELEKDPYLPPYYNPGPDAPEIKYMIERRKKLGGFLPERRESYTPIQGPGPDDLKFMRKGSGKQEVATTMAIVRIFKEMMHNDEIKKRLVPIIPDEARTFGMDSWFPTLKIYDPHGQTYTAVDHDLMLSYKESKNGQIMHEGICEAGSVAEFQAAGTSYATHGEPMIPLYIFYSMFGFQRTADSIWAAGDQMARGFLIGATAGRTTLTGEGLQHMDGNSLTIASTNPAVVSYDCAFAYELAHIIPRGVERMYGDCPGENVIYYLTCYNQPIHQPAEPENLDVEGVHRGIYRYKGSTDSQANILASGIGMVAAERAREILAEDYDVDAAIFSVTSWTELARDGAAKDLEQLREPAKDVESAFLAKQLEGASGPFVGVSDFTTSIAEGIRKWVPGDYTTLGCDGFGFSDTRPAARRFFNTDAESIVVAILMGLAREGKIDMSVADEAAKKFNLTDPTKA